MIVNKLNTQKVCVFIGGPSYFNNNLFDPFEKMNRDNCLLPFRLLKEELSKEGYNLTTEDMANGDPLFEIHMNAHENGTSNLKFLLYMEPDWHFPANAVGSGLLSQYDLVFTWNDDLLSQLNFVKMYLPNSLNYHDPDGFEKRDMFISMICGNNPIDSNHDAELYSERYQTIRKLEVCYSNYFHLYGRGWDLPVNKRSLSFRFLRKTAWMWQPWYRPFPSYRGMTVNKYDVYKRSRFAICYENCMGYSGYISEKIFDVMSAGCVPVYLGAKNIEDYVPNDCFIDRRSFKTLDDLVTHLISIDEQSFLRMQENIFRFLKSDMGQRFSAEFFAKKVTEKIVQHVKLQAC